MRVHEYAKNVGKKSDEVLAVISELNQDVPDGDESPFQATAHNSKLTGSEMEVLNDYFGLTAEPPPKKVIPIRKYEVTATRLKGKGPAFLKLEKTAVDEQEAIRQLISERGLKVNYYRFRAKKLKDLGPHVRNGKGELVPAA